ncbi:hypothetical protein PF005_g27158 [Phytophthora fragariae]|uniref:Retrovirus-related Pol polyprotein from transposon TNT 1-94 n=1 Tax=Phytophthora fragariae TaxID=53985 RepID=A0A6A3VQ37_9STRA|nr:hypothetical protein PF005_g27158 [Phytophthora fragariae]
MADGNAAISAPQFGSQKPPKYDEEGGFDLYKAMLQSYLAQRGCWGIMDGTDVLGANPSAAETTRHNEKNALARDALLRGVLIKDAAKICTMTEARKMWVAFELEKTKRNYSNSLFVRKKFYAYDYTHGMDMDQYLDEMEAMRRQLRNLNEIISDAEMVKVILQGVAYEYRGIVLMFDKDVRDGNTPLLADVLNTLRSEAELDKQRSSSRKKGATPTEAGKILQVQQQQQQGGSGKRKWKQKTGNKKKFKGKDGEFVETRTCHFCKKPGHLKRDCDEFLEKQRLKQQNAVGSAAKDGGKKKGASMSLIRWSGAGGGKPSSIGMVTMSDASTAPCDEWMVDTGAGVHVCTDWSAFASMKEDTLTFVGWKGDVSSSEACEQVSICATDAMTGGEVVLDLEDTRYTSGGATNLLSLECLEQCGWVPSYSDAERPEDRVMYLDRGGVRLALHKRNGHYWLQTKRAVADASMCMVVTTRKQSSLMRWHMKFAHLNVQALKRMVLKEMVDGMQSLKLDDFKEPLDCIACTMAKQRRMSYKPHNKRSKVCYDRLMSDVCSIGLETIGGNRYFQLVQDEASRYKWCYLLEHKSEATKNVTNLILRLEKEHVINRVTFDQGGEFVNKKMKSFLADHGIELRPTNAYTPEENSLVEKQNGNLMNKVRAIREGTGMPESLWGEILMYVVEFDNLSLTKALADMTPYQKLAGVKPDVGKLHVCGCVAFAHVPKKKRASKLSPKAVPTLFLGFSQSSMGYRLLNLLTGDMVERRDVSFRDDITVDSEYVENLLARRYNGSQVVLPDMIPFVRLPVNAVLDTVHLQDKTLEDADLSGDDARQSGGEEPLRKRRRVASSDSSSDESEEVHFSGSLRSDESPSSSPPASSTDDSSASSSSTGSPSSSISSSSSSSSTGSSSTSSSSSNNHRSSGSGLPRYKRYKWLIVALAFQQHEQISNVVAVSVQSFSSHWYRWYIRCGLGSTTANASFDSPALETRTVRSVVGDDLHSDVVHAHWDRQRAAKSYNSAPGTCFRARTSVA